MLQSHACYPLQTVPIPPHPRLLRPSQYNSKQFLATSLKLAFSQCINVIPGQQTVTKTKVHKLSPSVTQVDNVQATWKCGDSDGISATKL